MEEGLETFHQYSFATLRQYGACFELVETYLDWLSGHGEEGLEEATGAFRDISSTAKAFQFQLARAMARGRDLPLDPLDQMAEHWEHGVGLVRERYG